MPLQAIALFCEDIRAEQSGQDTLIGVLPDNMQIGQTPGFIPKLGIYVRILLATDSSAQNIILKMALPDNQEMILGNLEQLIEQARSAAISNKMPYIGLIAKAVMSPFHDLTAGKITVIAHVDGVDYICGALNLVSNISPPISTVSPPLA
jgi:hypothetical protein